MAKVMMVNAVVSIVMMLGCSLLIKETRAVMDETNVIHVGGKVMCQDCSQGWNEWVKGARPIIGCKVSVTCLDERKRVCHYGSDTTDDDGEFNMLVEKNVYGKKLNPKDCIVRLVSSPDPTCNVATDFAQGKTGVKLRQPSVQYRGMTKYILGPFYYTTPACSEPDTTHQGSY